MTTPSVTNSPVLPQSRYFEIHAPKPVDQLSSIDKYEKPTNNKNCAETAPVPAATPQAPGKKLTADEISEAVKKLAQVNLAAAEAFVATYTLQGTNKPQDRAKVATEFALWLANARHYELATAFFAQAIELDPASLDSANCFDQIASKRPESFAKLPFLIATIYRNPKQCTVTPQKIGSWSKAFLQALIDYEVKTSPASITLTPSQKTPVITQPLAKKVFEAVQKQDLDGTLNAVGELFKAIDKNGAAFNHDDAIDTVLVLGQALQLASDDKYQGWEIALIVIFAIIIPIIGGLTVGAILDAARHKKARDFTHGIYNQDAAIKKLTDNLNKLGIVPSECAFVELLKRVGVKEPNLSNFAKYLSLWVQQSQENKEDPHLKREEAFAAQIRKLMSKSHTIDESPPAAAIVQYRDADPKVKKDFPTADSRFFKVGFVGQTIGLAIDGATTGGSFDSVEKRLGVVGLGRYLITKFTGPTLQAIIGNDKFNFNLGFTPIGATNHTVSITSGGVDGIPREVFQPAYQDINSNLTNAATLFSPVKTAYDQYVAARKNPSNGGQIEATRNTLREALDTFRSQSATIISNLIKANDALSRKINAGKGSGLGKDRGEIHEDVTAGFGGEFSKGTIEGKWGVKADVDFDHSTALQPGGIAKTVVVAKRSVDIQNQLKNLIGNSHDRLSGLANLPEITSTTSTRDIDTLVQTASGHLTGLSTNYQQVLALQNVNDASDEQACANCEGVRTRSYSIATPHFGLEIEIGKKNDWHLSFKNSTRVITSAEELGVDGNAFYVTTGPDGKRVETTGPISKSSFFYSPDLPPLGDTQVDLEFKKWIHNKYLFNPKVSIAYLSLFDQTLGAPDQSPATLALTRAGNQFLSVDASVDLKLLNRPEGLRVGGFSVGGHAEADTFFATDYQTLEQYWTGQNLIVGMSGKLFWANYTQKPDKTGTESKDVFTLSGGFLFGGGGVGSANFGLNINFSNRYNDLAGELGFAFTLGNLMPSPGGAGTIPTNFAGGGTFTYAVPIDALVLLLQKLFHPRVKPSVFLPTIIGSSAGSGAFSF